MAVRGSGGARAALRGRLLARIERAAAPYAQSRLLDPLVVVAPHPDDEVLGCGGLVLRKRAVGASVRLVYVADGATSHQRFIGPEAVRMRRRLEAYEAASRLGVDAADVTLLDFPDGDLSAHVDSVGHALEEIFRAHGPLEIAVPHALEPPADHRATYTAARAAASALPRAVLLEYGIWMWRSWPVVPLPGGGRRAALEGLLRGVRNYNRLGTAFNVALDVQSEMPEKHHALAAHASQVHRPDEFPAWPVLSDIDGGAWLNSLFGNREYYRESVLGNSGNRGLFRPATPTSVAESMLAS